MENFSSIRKSAILSIIVGVILILVAYSFYLFIWDCVYQIYGDRDYAFEKFIVGGLLYNLTMILQIWVDDRYIFKGGVK